MPRPTHPLAVRLLSGLLAVLGLATVLEARAWWGALFPGFFLLPNRVVASAGPPGWAGASEGRPVFQQVLLAVDRRAVASAEAGYEAAARHPLGAGVTYSFADGGSIRARVLPLRRLTGFEYLAIFGAYGLTGFAYLLLALVAGERWESDPRAPALTAFAWAGGTFSFTGLDLYAPGAFFRLHAAAETFLLAGCVHLALVWPTPQWAKRPPGLPRLIYGLAGVFAVVYQLFLYDPRPYTVLHNLCQGLLVVPTLALAVRLALADDASDSAQARAVRRMLLATLVGLVAPGVLLGVSGLTGGDLPVSMSAWVNFLFPLACVGALRANAHASAVDLRRGVVLTAAR